MDRKPGAGNVSLNLLFFIYSRISNERYHECVNAIRLLYQQHFFTASLT